MTTKTFAHCPACHRLMTSEGICTHCPPFGGVPFDPDIAGERATHGQFTLALWSAHGLVTKDVKLQLEQFADLVNLTEAPEVALAELLDDLMHYCHREGLTFSDVLKTAKEHFDLESGGATL